MPDVAGVAIAGVAAVARSRPAAMTWATIAAVLVASDVRVHCDGLAAGGFGRCLRGCALAVVGFLGRAVGAGAVVVAAAEVAGFAVAGGFVARVRYFDGDR